MDALREEKLAEDTLVFSRSDNGPWLMQGRAGGSAGMLRDGKGSTWEGGMREPGIAWWPGKIKAGEVCRTLASSMDLFTTSLDLAGAPIPGRPGHRWRRYPPAAFWDGRRGARRLLLLPGTRLFAARQGRFKAHYFTQTGYSQPKPDAHDPPLLFDLGADPGESFDVASSHPEILAEIAAAVERHKATVMPATNQLEAIVPAE